MQLLFCGLQMLLWRVVLGRVALNVGQVCQGVGVWAGESVHICRGAPCNRRFTSFGRRTGCSQAFQTLTPERRPVMARRFDGPDLILTCLIETKVSDCRVKI